VRLRKKESAKVQQQLQDALAAREDVEQAAERAEEGASMLRGLRARWGRVHERNHLARMFDQEWRATN